MSEKKTEEKKKTLMGCIFPVLNACQLSICSSGFESEIVNALPLTMQDSVAAHTHTHTHNYTLHARAPTK